jgi:hypothetical protein
MKRKIEAFRRIIERTDWDKDSDEQKRFLNGVSWIAIILAVIVFGPVILDIIKR